MPDSDTDSNGDVTNIGDTTVGKCSAEKEECQYDNDSVDNLGDKIDYNDNISKVSTLATSNEAAYNVVIVNQAGRSKNNRKTVPKRAKSRKLSS